MPATSLELRPPIAVVSDLHLVHPGTYLRDYRGVLPLLDGCASVCFNGDTCELLHLARREPAREQLALLLDTCSERGWDSLCLTGNHDPTVSSLHALSLLGGRAFLTHGDVLHPEIAPWSRERAALAAERERLLLGEPEPRDAPERLRLSKHCSMVASLYDRPVKAGWLGRAAMVGKFVREPWRVPRVLRYWASVGAYGRQFHDLACPNARLLLIGHTHHAGVWQQPTFWLVNTGSFQPLSRALVTILHEDHATVYATERRGGEFRRSTILHRIPLAE